MAAASDPTTAGDAQIVASVLGADYAHLADEVADLEQAGVDRIQWDIMDGAFVPNLTFGAEVVAACREGATVPYEAHLMVADPDLVAPWFTDSCELVIVHAETAPHLHRTLGVLRDAGVRTGVALNPATPLDAVHHVLDLTDLLLVMTVNPGFGGQDYIAAMEPKITAAAEMIAASGHDIVIEVDGGISASTVAGAYGAGARYLVAGSSILKHPDGKAGGVKALRAAL